MIRLHGVENVAAGEVDRTGAVEVEVEVGPLGGDQGSGHPGHVAAGEGVGLEPAWRDVVAQTGLRRHDLGLDDRPRVDLAETHAEELEKCHRRLRPVGLEPELSVIEDKQEHRQGDEPEDDRGAREHFGG